MRFLFLLILGLVAACKPVAAPERSQLLNIDSLLDAQLRVVRSSAIDKKIVVNDSTFRAIENNSKLATELLAFRELGQMNRPIYRNAYRVSILPDTQSNLTVKAWQTEDEVPVKSVKMYYLDKIDRIKRIEAQLSMNEFYAQSSKKIQLDFSILGDTVLLEKYSISGQQRYFWSTPRYFSVDAVIRR